MTFAFHPEAELEFIEAIAFFEEREELLGLDFSREVYHALNNITDFPEAWPLISSSHRRYLLTRFPYGLIYEIGENGVFVVAVMHLSRDPAYWATRLTDSRE